MRWIISDLGSSTYNNIIIKNKDWGDDMTKKENMERETAKKRHGITYYVSCTVYNMQFMNIQILVYIP